MIKYQVRKIAKKDRLYYQIWKVCQLPESANPEDYKYGNEEHHIVTFKNWLHIEEWFKDNKISHFEIVQSQIKY